MISVPGVAMINRFIPIFILITSVIICFVGSIYVHNVEFKNEPCIIPYKQYDYILCEPLIIMIDGNPYVIPKNFKTDLASVPKIFWTIFPPQYTNYVAPAILHDYLYSKSGLISRKFADDVLYSALLAKEVSTLTALKFYCAVRLFGAAHFNE